MVLSDYLVWWLYRHSLSVMSVPASEHNSWTCAGRGDSDWGAPLPSTASAAPDGRTDAPTRTDLKIAWQPSRPTTRIRLDAAPSWPRLLPGWGWGRQRTKDGWGTSWYRGRERQSIRSTEGARWINHCYCHESRVSPAFKLHFVYVERPDNRPCHVTTAQLPV